MYHCTEEDQKVDQELEACMESRLKLNQSHMWGKFIVSFTVVVGVFAAVGIFSL
ncbi:hypothetical protein VPBG_00208 [Vibrio phage helene 12B3]|uniref:hypothetical protein n=1 Tax=Vibrio phage helene 12B3 TaxID=573173 RepID=UPI0002C0FADA|nr:hypothetical protein VPBG_00208 [Vibrio phage helene 12B3]YP_009223077.1 hypothetical protein VPLG_00228 [Vibrio phage eugene 12A10]AGG57980.1 hypothetical protein VPBG_00208 [Vibrio phage helene 12B3]AGN51667.1 hypothetical protein VPLG_00228 [Vibrio phage eugene 12A10]